MSHLSVWNPDYTSTRQKALEDAKKMQQVVQDECIKSGKELPPYELQELIGKGSFGRVYKANDPRSQMVVAVKIIDIEESDTLNPKLADTYSEFMKEINALKLLSDSGAKNINYVLDVLPVGQSMWMVTEYCAGGSVATLMKPTAPGGLQEKWIIPILREVAEAIHWVHKEGIIHRDIKCANVLVTESGSVQLCDFGVAGIIETKLDKRSTFIGTPHWMAPELFDPVPSYSTPVDIWAFGSLVYEIASGLPPNVMSGFNIPQLGNYIKSHAPRLEGDQYSPQIKHLVAFCLVEDPAKRPTIEQVQQHPYIANSSEDYPTSSLVNLVRAYKLWESQGGIRKSLFAPGGAQGPSDFNLSDFGNDEWNFSTTVDFDQSMTDTDARAVYDVYGSNVEFDFQSQPTQKPKSSRRRLPPQLNPVKAPLEKIFDPNTISNYDENSRAYYGKPPPPPTATQSDLPLRDNSVHNTLRESLIDLDASLHDGGHLSQFVDMETIKAGPGGGPRISVDDFEEITDFSKPPLSDPADFKVNRRTQDWKFPSMAPPASANPDMTHFPFNEDPAPRSAVMDPGPGPVRPTLMHHPTDPTSLQSQLLYDHPHQLAPKAAGATMPVVDNRASVGSLIDLDESLPDTMNLSHMSMGLSSSMMSVSDQYTRPSTANSDVISVSGSDMGGPTNPFELERHASLLYHPPPNIMAQSQSSTREPSIYISDDSDLAARLATAPGADEESVPMPQNQTQPSQLGQGPGPVNGLANLPLRDSGYEDDDGYSTSDYFDTDYLAMGGGRRSESRSRSRSRGPRMIHPNAANMNMNASVTGPGPHNMATMSALSDLPPVPAPPSVRVMQNLADRDEIKEEFMRLLGSFQDHLSYANSRVSTLPVRAARRGVERDREQPAGDPQVNGPLSAL
ncbi:Serine/threonine-protein kinase nak1 [Naviculisporaceae sp. PSN 640]